MKRNKKTLGDCYENTGTIITKVVVCWAVKSRRLKWAGLTGHSIPVPEIRRRWKYHVNSDLDNTGCGVIWSCRKRDPTAFLCISFTSSPIRIQHASKAKQLLRFNCNFFSIHKNWFKRLWFNKGILMNILQLVRIYTIVGLVVSMSDYWSWGRGFDPRHFH